MQRDYRRWRSPRLQRDMELLIFGHAGAKVLMFPTRDGRFWEYEKIEVVARLADKVDAGHLQLYCIEGLGAGDLLRPRSSSGRPHPPARRLRGLHPRGGVSADVRDQFPRLHDGDGLQSRGLPGRSEEH